jgi:ABC-type dipeptide/oligopeptide/nickel transport system ATPase component
MRTFTLLPILLGCLAFCACDNKQNEVANLEHETEVIHDDAMAQMSAMQRISRQIKEQIQQHTADPAKLEQMKTVLLQMRKADEDMSVWMVNYKSPQDMAPDAALLYLLEQKRLIEENRRDILYATETGKHLLEKP